MKFIDDLSKVLNILVRNAETNFGRQSLNHHYVPVSTRRMRCKSCQRRWKRELFAKDNLSLERTKSNTSKYMGSQNSDVSSMPRETESNLQTWNFDPIPSESRDLPDESYKDKQYMQRIEEFKYDAQPSQKLHFIAKEFIKKINKKIYHNAKHVTRFFLHVVFNNVTSLPLYLWPKLTKGHYLGLSLASWEDKGYVDLPSQSTASRPLQCGFSERHYLHELRKQIKIHKLNVVMILKKLKWLILILHNGKGSIHRPSSKIKRLGRSVSQRRMPRETEKPPLTMIDEKPTDGTNTSKKDHDGQWNDEVWEFFKGVPNPDDELKKFFRQGDHRVMNVNFFLTEFF